MTESEDTNQQTNDTECFNSAMLRTVTTATKSYLQYQLRSGDHVQMIHSPSMACQDHPFYLINSTFTNKYQRQEPPPPPQKMKK